MLKSISANEIFEGYSKVKMFLRGKEFREDAYFVKR
jgi:hypothetical protein